ncbi:thiamine diphosphokinase [Sneathia sanguinegens]|uniref:thiamine diphosphokinase n=1 Tax=Sneathia sanguinegens TaxID=40543 RepID=UPI00082FEAE7|nr:thiamine diphosphokinase [Sneathia sanguinegens]
MKIEYVVFLNGVYPKDIEKLKNIVKDKRIICADGGTNTCFEMGLIPEVIIGDLDSIREEVLEFYKNVRVIKTIKEKDYTDFELALMYIENEKLLDVTTRFKSKNSIEKESRVTPVLVVGATGNRVDMTLSNILKLQSNKNMIFLTESFEYMRYIKLNKSVEVIEKLSGKTFSIIPITDLKKLDLKGFVYNLDKVDIDKSIGLASNIVKEDKAYIYCEKGEMYLIHE